MTQVSQVSHDVIVKCAFCKRRAATITIHVNRATRPTCESCAFTVLETER